MTLKKDPEEFATLDSEIEEKQSRIVPMLIRIFSALNDDERAAAQRKILHGLLSGLKIRLLTATRCFNEDKDENRKKKNMTWIPTSIIHINERTQEFRLLAKEGETLENLQTEAEEVESSVRDIETAVGVHGNDDLRSAGSTLKRFRKLIRQGTINFVTHGDKHFKKHLYKGNPQDAAKRQDQGQYSVSHESIVSIEKTIIADAMAGKGKLVERDNGFFVFVRCPEGLGYEATTGAPATIIRFEITEDLSVHSHPRNDEN